jgi:mannitol/fructose-specific phosphotransferase system IIA component (Ntr-type)
MSVNLDKKNINIKAIAKKAVKDNKLLDKLLENLWSKNETIRYNSHKVLLEISEEQPKVLYGHWDYLVKFLDSDNTYHKLSAVILLASLTKADKNNKFEKIFNKFYGLLNDKSFITAAYVSGASGKIALAKPKLEVKITNRLLSIDKTHHQQERKDLAKASIIEAFGEYYDKARYKKRIVGFVEKQLNCASPKTRKAAKEFLKRTNQPVQK